MPSASIIIPNLNGRHHLNDCLNSIRQQTVTDFEVVLADNGSTDGSQAFVKQHFPEVRLVEIGYNSGFTGACNAGYMASTGKIAILLNNDTEVVPTWLASILDAFDRFPNVGIVACKMMLFDQRDHFHTAGDFYRIDGIPGNRGVWQKDEGQYEQEEFVFSGCGGGAAYRRTMIEEIGFLDDDFFFSCEDVDLAWRAQLAGWKTLYVPTAVIYHKLKASAGAGPMSSYYDGRNFLYIIWKNYPTSLLQQHWPKILKAQWNITKEALLAWRGEAARATLRGQLAGLMGVTSMWPKRQRIQQNRQIDDESLTAVLTPVDEKATP